MLCYFLRNNFFWRPIYPWNYSRVLVQLFERVHRYCQQIHCVTSRTERLVVFLSRLLSFAIIENGVWKWWDCNVYNAFMYKGNNSYRTMGNHTEWLNRQWIIVFCRICNDKYSILLQLYTMQLPWNNVIFAI